MVLLYYIAAIIVIVSFVKMTYTAHYMAKLTDKKDPWSARVISRLVWGIADVASLQIFDEKKH
ncbi:MAG: hypothetical protein ACKOXB_13790 [Flavobacteriales bacterium]